jgi:hypothetical protein
VANTINVSLYDKLSFDVRGAVPFREARHPMLGPGHGEKNSP